jgi:hypothetical protein
MRAPHIHSVTISTVQDALNKQGETPLFTAINADAYEVARELVNSGTHPHPGALRPLSFGSTGDQKTSAHSVLRL